MIARKLTPTILSKVAGTTASSALAVAGCEQLANLMCHQPDTQRRNSAVKQRKKSNLAVTALMSPSCLDSDKASAASNDGDEPPAQAQAVSGDQVERKRKPFEESEIDVLTKAMTK